MTVKKPFLDTNVLIYAHLGSEDRRAVIAQQLIEAGGVTGVQQLTNLHP